MKLIFTLLSGKCFQIFWVFKNLQVHYQLIKMMFKDISGLFISFPQPKWLRDEVPRLFVGPHLPQKRASIQLCFWVPETRFFGCCKDLHRYAVWRLPQEVSRRTLRPHILARKCHHPVGGNHPHGGRRILPHGHGRVHNLDKINLVNRNC